MAIKISWNNYLIQCLNKEILKTFIVAFIDLSNYIVFSTTTKVVFKFQIAFFLNWLVINSFDYIFVFLKIYHKDKFKLN